MAKPKIRLKGFKGEWENKLLGNLCSVNRGVRVTRKELNNQGDYPVFQNTDYPMGFYNQYNVAGNNPFVIIGGSAGLIGFSKKEFWAADDCVYFGDNAELDKAYLFNILLKHSSTIKKNVRGSSVPRLDRKVLVGLSISIPSIDEQQGIADYFKSLDSMIQGVTKKIASLKQMKQACLVSMFPQAGETTPRVRFKGFKGEWGKDKAGNLFMTFNERNRPDLPVLSANQDIRGMAPRTDTGYNISHNKANEVTYKVVKPGQYVIHLRSFQGGFAHSSVEGITSPAYTVFGFKDAERHDDYFWKIIFMSKEFIKSLETITYGIRDGRSISFSEFAEMNFYFPSKEEQQQIASFFTSLDKQISLQEARLEKLKQIKAACLDKMFV